MLTNLKLLTIRYELKDTGYMFFKNKNQTTKNTVYHDHPVVAVPKFEVYKY